MQISAANLLLAGQQTAAPRAQGTSFAAAMAPAKLQRFSPPDLASETEDPAPPAAQIRAATPQTGYSAATAPGSQLDIRV